MANKEIKVTVYRWAGQKLFWKIRSSCEECDSCLRIVKDVVDSRFSQEPVTLEIKNWLDYPFEALARGGWHAPIIVVDGALFSQGVVPRSETLINFLATRLKKSNSA